MNRLRCNLANLLALVVILANTGSAAASASPGSQQTANVSGDELLEIAHRAWIAGEIEWAESAYRALFADPSISVRSEARFRLALMMVVLRRLPEAATLLRQVLDEQPEAQRVRLELARVLELMGDQSGARRALREAQAGALPPDVARLVDRYSAALRAQKRLGASIDIALAPDTNINRATRSDTLGTVLGDFEIDEHSQQRSGLGLALRGQGYARLPVGKAVNLFGRVSTSADLYREGAFSDIALAATLGPEVRLGADRVSVELGGVSRWYGGAAHSRAWTANLNYVHPLGRTAELRGTASVASIDNRLADVQDGWAYSASLSYERALSNHAGAGLSLSADRQALGDPGYSTWAGQATLFGYRDFGPVTLITTLTHGRLKADERLLLFPKTRYDRLYRASLAGTFRNLRIGTLAPFVRATYERNRSTTEMHDFSKLRTEFGVTRAF